MLAMYQLNAFDITVAVAILACAFFVLAVFASRMRMSVSGAGIAIAIGMVTAILADILPKHPSSTLSSTFEEILMYLSVGNQYTDPGKSTAIEGMVVGFLVYAAIHFVIRVSVYIVRFVRRTEPGNALEPISLNAR